MNNYYTLKKLINNISGILTGAVFSHAITPRKNVIEFYLVNPNERYRIIADTGSANTVFFLDKYQPAKKSNVYNPFESLNNAKIKGIEIADRDRYISLTFEDGHKLAFILYGPHANVFLAKKNEIIESFKDNENNKGNPLPQPRAATLWRDINTDDKIKRKITRLNPLFPRKLIAYIINNYRLKEKSDEELISIVKKLSDELANNPVPRILETGEICLLSEDSLPEPTAKKFINVNECVRYRYYHGLSKANFKDIREQMESRFNRLLKKMKNQLRELEMAGKSLERADKYEKYGHLLMANIHRKDQVHSGEIQVSDFYDNNKTLSIPLQADRNLADNAQYYYGKAKKAKKSYDVAQARVKKVRNETDKLETLYQEFQSIDQKHELKKWMKHNKRELDEYHLTGGKDQKQVYAPFRKLAIDGYEFWIGKNAKSNDKLTSMAHKEDIWLHARGVSGSHVVIRMDNNKDYPQKGIILKAAGLAAFYSKAKGSKMVPVSYTKKKYVRKPKGAAAGMVVLDREEVVMVEPEANV